MYDPATPDERREVLSPPDVIAPVGVQPGVGDVGYVVMNAVVEGDEEVPNGTSFHIPAHQEGASSVISELLGETTGVWGTTAAVRLQRGRVGAILSTLDHGGIVAARVGEMAEAYRGLSVALESRYSADDRAAPALEATGVVVGRAAKAVETMHRARELASQLHDMLGQLETELASTPKMREALVRAMLALEAKD